MPRIVIIEEDDLMRALLEEWLAGAGYLASSRTLHEAPVEGKVDLVIVDIYRPRHAGSKVVRAVKTAYPGTPVIAISGQFRSGLAGPCAPAQTLGVRHVIPKPFSRGDLLASVSSVVPPAR